MELRLSNGNDNGKKAIGLDWQRKILQVLHTFLYIFLPSPHDYDVKLPIFRFLEDKLKTTTYLFLSWTSMQSFGITLQKNLPPFDELIEME